MPNQEVIASPVVELTLDTTKFVSQFNGVNSLIKQKSEQLQSSVNNSFKKINSSSVTGLERSAIKSFNSVAYGAIRMGKQVEQALKMAVVPAAALVTTAFNKLYKSNTQAGDSFRAQFNPVKKEFDEAVVRIGSYVAQSKIFGKSITEWAQTAANALNKLNSQDVQRFVNLLASGLKTITLLHLAIIGLRFSAGFLKTIEAISKLGIGGGLASLGGAGASAGGNVLGQALGGATAGGTAIVASKLFDKTTMVSPVGFSPRSSIGKMENARWARWSNPAGKIATTASEAEVAKAAAATSAMTTGTLSKFGALAKGLSIFALRLSPWIIIIAGVFSAIEKIINKFSSIESKGNSAINGFKSTWGALSKLFEVIGNDLSLTIDAIGGFFSELLTFSQNDFGFGQVLPNIIKGLKNKYNELATPEPLKGGEYVSESGAREMGWSKTQMDSYNNKLKQAYKQREGETNVPLDDAKKRLESMRTGWIKKLAGIGIIESDISQEFDNYVKGVSLETDKSEDTVRKNIPKIKQQATNKTLAEFPELKGMPVTSSTEIRKKVEEQLSIFGKAIESAKAQGKLGLPEKMINEMQETLEKLYEVYHAHMANLKGEIESSKEYVQNGERYEKAKKEKTYRINELEGDEVVKGKDWIRNWTKRKEDFDNIVREMGGGTRKYETEAIDGKTRNYYSVKGKYLGSVIVDAVKTVTGKYTGTEVTSSDRATAMTTMQQLMLHRQEKMGLLGYTGQGFGFSETEKFAGEVRKRGEDKREELAQKMYDAEKSLTEATIDNNDKVKSSTDSIIKLKDELINTQKAFELFVKLVTGGMPAGQAGGYAPIP